MANTKVTQHVIANNAITADQIASAAVTDAKLHATLDLSGKTLTLPATAIPSASTATTQSASDNSTKLATTAYVTTAIANLNDSAPAALNTLNELAAALNDDASFSSTITTALGTKLPLAGGTMTGDLILGDNIILEIGSGSGGDLRLYHDGNNSAIQNTTGDLFIYGGTNEIRLRAKNDEESLVAFPNGKVELYFDNASKLETTTTGVSILGTGALKIPVGTTGERPSAATGQLRWNTTDGKLEIYDGSAWSNVSAGTSNKVLDTFTGDNSTTAFTLTETPANEDALMVFINGAYQEKGDYSLSGKVLTLDVAPLSAEKVVVHTTIGAVHDGTAALNQQFTATAGQTAFTLGADPQHENNTQVYINGVYQQKTNYTVSGTTLTFDTGLTVGDVVEVNSFTVTNLGGTDSVTEGVSNLYHTTARARGAISVTGNAIGYNSSTGVITANFEEGPTFTSSVTVNPGSYNTVLGGNSLTFSRNGDNNILSQGGSSANLLINSSNQIRSTATSYHSWKTGSGADERMRIKSDGNVGIGETSPAARLHVEHDSSTAYNGATEITESLIVSNKNGTDNSGVNNVTSIGLHVADGATSQGFINYVRTGNNTGDFTFTQRTGSSTYAEAMRIDSSGNVGITAAASLRFNSASDNTHAVGYDSTVDGSFIRGQNGIRVLTGTSGGTERMRVNTTGVGIGNTNPSRALLHVGGDGIALNTTTDVSKTAILRTSGNGNYSTSGNGSAAHALTLMRGNNAADGDQVGLSFVLDNGNWSATSEIMAEVEQASSANTRLNFKTWNASGAMRTTQYITSEGQVVKPYQSGFYAVKSSAQTISVNQAVIFNTTTENVGGDYNTSNGVYTAPMSGFYIFSYTILLGANLSNDIDVDHYLKTSNRSYIGGMPGRIRYLSSGATGWGDGYMGLGHTQIAYMDAGDTAYVDFSQLYYNNSNGTAPVYANTGNNWTKFSGYFLG